MKQKQKIYNGMFIGSILIIILVITFLGITSLLKKIETKSAEAGLKTGEFIRNPAQIYTNTNFDVKVLRNDPVALETLSDVSVEDKIRYYSSIYNVDADDAIRIAKCESGLNPKAENINGSATGVFQFIRKTWKNYCDGDVYNEDANIICFMRLYPDNKDWWQCK